ncbi:SPOR domain-containing protein [Aromatoleum petrolei]|uniref:SPOR domain-containing protein n=1 Tax=Aromatoleum petrolei TaxID=76116 RepID=A0ABX1MSD3_9RHOO|nr:SPOR domain-containing protein [Aromatoleum petrolei]NMF89503.1 SPOR domain-containing protein [Aromatoleum petrolei]QTQ37278.1 Sporulation-like domain-containing protein [Aromatoleum petrolei]
MRIVFVILVLLNLLALASIRGWLGTPAPEGEPERLSNQLNPERIVLRPGGNASQHDAAAPTPATAESGDDRDAETPPAPTTPAIAAAAAPAAPQACTVIGALAESEADALMQTAIADKPGLRGERKSSSTPTAWWVRIPPNGGRDAAERRVAELRGQGVSDLFIVNDPGPNQYAISLGLFKTEAKAQQHLANLQAKRVRGASIASRTTAVHRIEVRGPASAVKALTSSPAVRRSGATISECTP